MAFIGKKTEVFNSEDKIYIVYIKDFMKEQKENKFISKGIRLTRYLYSLGFEKESKEIWLFDYNENLQKALDFYFSMRKIIKTKE